MSREANWIEPNKNLHAKVTSALLTELEKTAQAEHITVDELVQEAVVRHIQKDGWQELAAFGTRNAKARGLKPSDVSQEIAKLCRESRKRGK